MAFKNWRNVQVTISDGDAPVNSIILVFDTDAALNIPGVVVNFLKDRGLLPISPETTDGEEQEMDGGWTLLPETLFAAAADIAAQLAFQALPFGWVSTTDNSDTLDVTITDGTDTLLAPDSVIRGNWSDGGVGGEAQVMAFTFRTPHNFPTVS